MRRLVIALAAIPLLVAGAAAGANPVLRDQVVVDDDFVRLGDIFDGAGEKGDVAVARAPGLGRRGIYDATWLLTVARANDFPWRPQSRFDRVVVERASQTIDGGDIEALLKTTIAERFAQAGRPKKIQVELENRNLRIHMAPRTQPDIRVRDLWIDREGHRFTASVVVPSPGATSGTKVAGRIYEVRSIPVLNRRVARGEIVAEQDVEWIEVQASAVNRNILTDSEDIVGMTPRRYSAPGAPLRSGDFRPPVVVAKGSLVTILLETPAMVLTAQGRAAEDGAQNAVIKVTNTHSRKTVDAVVKDSSTVLIAAPASAR